MAKKPTYDQKFCKKHNRHYAGYLKECSDCASESISEEHRKELNRINKRLARLK